MKMINTVELSLAWKLLNTHFNNNIEDIPEEKNITIICEQRNVTKYFLISLIAIK